MKLAKLMLVLVGAFLVFLAANTVYAADPQCNDYDRSNEDMYASFFDDDFAYSSQNGFVHDKCSMTGAVCSEDPNDPNCVRTGKWNGDNDKFLDEAICENGVAVYRSQECRYGCRNDKCVKKEPNLVIDSVFVDNGYINVRYCNYGGDPEIDANGEAPRFYIKVADVDREIVRWGKAEAEIDPEVGDVSFAVPMDNRCKTAAVYPETYFNFEPGQAYQLWVVLNWDGSADERTPYDNEHWPMVIGGQKANVRSLDCFAQLDDYEYLSPYYDNEDTLLRLAYLRKKNATDPALPSLMDRLIAEHGGEEWALPNIYNPLVGRCTWREHGDTGQCGIYSYAESKFIEDYGRVGCNDTASGSRIMTQAVMDGYCCGSILAVRNCQGDLPANATWHGDGTWLGNGSLEANYSQTDSASEDCDFGCAKGYVYENGRCVMFEPTAVGCDTALNNYSYLSHLGSSTLFTAAQSGDFTTLNAMLDGVIAEYGGKNFALPVTNSPLVGQCAWRELNDTGTCFVYSYKRNSKVSPFQNTSCDDVESGKLRMRKAVSAGYCCPTGYDCRGSLPANTEWWGNRLWFGNGSRDAFYSAYDRDNEDCDYGCQDDYERKNGVCVAVVSDDTDDDSKTGDDTGQDDGDTITDDDIEGSEDDGGEGVEDEGQGEEGDEDEGQGEEGDEDEGQGEEGDEDDSGDTDEGDGEDQDEGTEDGDEEEGDDEGENGDEEGNDEQEQDEDDIADDQQESDDEEEQEEGKIADDSTKKEECMQGGWQDFVEPVFRNQGDCISWIVSNGKRKGRADDYQALKERAAKIKKIKKSENKLVLKLGRQVSQREKEVVEEEKRRVRQADPEVTRRLKGKVVLQVESNGEAWYVDTETGNRFYMKDGESAYEVLRAFGRGISSQNLAKVPVGYDERLSENLEDSDGDTLSDSLEEALGTDPYSRDTDGDNYSDDIELVFGYDPRGEGRQNSDKTFANSLEDGIYLQVSGKNARGQAWLIRDGKRYYIDPRTAYNALRYLSMGASNEDLGKVEVGEYESGE